MTNMTKRFSISITPEIQKELDTLKKDKFYDKPQSEMVRFLILTGIKTALKEAKRA